MRIEAGGVVEQLDCAPLGVLTVSYARCDDGWLAEFTVSPGVGAHDAVNDLAVIHRLTAPTLGAARRAVPPAVAYLAGEPLDPLC
ncbi:MAG TPA: hypothetical protein VNB94_02595 [Mycobacteriales bacterium]|nr:hypothetical protein [Mycobacteriales bacterium]